MTCSEQASKKAVREAARETGGQCDEQGDDYVAPEIVVHDGDAFVKRLGPAQACSPGNFPP